MEAIKLLELCHKNHTTIRRAFSTFGVSSVRDGRKPLSKHTESMVFACIMNWLVQRMRGPERVTVRHRVGRNTYEMRFSFTGGRLRVSVPKVVSTDKNFILYDWAENDTLIELTGEKINASVERANEIGRRKAKVAKQATSTQDEACASQAEVGQLTEEIEAHTSMVELDQIIIDI